MEENKDAITVTVGIFSGRPNPVIVLDGQAAEDFANMLRSSIGKEPIHPPPPPKLGYFYGFHVKVPRQLASRLEVPAEFKIYSGVVSEGDRNKSNHWQDGARIENFLFEQAYKQGHGELLDKVMYERTFTPPISS